MLNPYFFVKTLSDLCDEQDIVVVDGGGTNVYVSFQAFQVKAGQRMILSTALCAMGSGLPESIGACIASGRRRTICLCGDGSLQLNIQELQTIKHHHLPVKIFVSNNGGYVSIRNTQNEFLEGRHTGSDAFGGMSLPDFPRVAAAYGLPATRITEASGLVDQITQALVSDGPFFCEVLTNPDQEVTPRQGFDRRADGTFAPRALEDMAPYLDRQELESLMFVPLSQ